MVRVVDKVSGPESRFVVPVTGATGAMGRAIAERIAARPTYEVVLVCCDVASYWAGGLDLEDLEFKRRRYDNDGAYRQSKQADRMLTVAFAERLERSHVTVNACHPGDLVSTLSRNLGFGGHQRAGARHSLRPEQR